MAVAPVVDLDYEKNKRTLAEMDDATLVFVVLGLQGEMEGEPGWGKSAMARQMLRQAFTEVAQRWIPLDVFDNAFQMLIGEDAEVAP